MTRSLALAWIGMCVLFVAAVAVTASRLTFFWDDYNTILTVQESPLGALLKGSGGHWAPLAGALFSIELHVFGYWYPGYAMVSAMLACLTWWLLWRTLAKDSERRPWLWLVGGVLYLTSVGVLVNLFVATTVAFVLATACATGAAFALKLGYRYVGASLLIASFLSMSGIFVVNASLVASVLVLSPAALRPGPETSAGRRALAPAVIFLAGVLGTVVGHSLALANPTAYYATATGASAATGGGVGQALSALDTAFFLLTAWIPSPLLPGVLSSTSLVTTLAIFLEKYAAVTVLGLAVAATIGAGLVRRDGVAGGQRLRNYLAPMALLIPAAVWALEVAWARPDAVFTLRYALLWLLSILSFWVVVFARSPRDATLRRLSNIGAALLAASAVVAVVLFPRALVAATNVDKGRWELSAVQDRQQQACLAGLDFASVEDIAPSFTDEQVCSAVRYVKETSLTGALLGYPG